MADKINQAYAGAVASGLLPGACLMAGDKDGKAITSPRPRLCTHDRAHTLITGKVLYSNSFGRASLKADRPDAFSASTVCSLASMSKVMTSVAVLQCVEAGRISLDENVRPLLPEMGKYGVATGFDDKENSAVLTPDETPISLRMLLSHTSGHEYDWLNPMLGKWRTSRGEQPWTGPTVADKSALPLGFVPGTGFAYGAGHDWAGKVVEVVTGVTLDEFMRRSIWSKLGVQGEVTFYPKSNPSMKDRMADISTLSERNEPPATDEPTFDILFGGTDCLGGAGVYAPASAFFTILSAIFRRDPKLLTRESYQELFRPQLDERAEQALNEYFHLSPIHSQFLGLGVPQEIRKTWSFAGLVVKDDLQGRFKRSTTMWGGVPSMMWFMDHKAGTFGTAFCQILPPMSPPIMALHFGFQSRVLEIAGIQ
ncbi:Beta-lactamase/transpeptidase-like protein [Moelleriella libera RCEF 2490]|uniref:Beta-lactamase/transpeptidase-like protein n=1 Tax=Moelleriella libera RCEF 2490 TaxID=1081109 RepID=A0A167XJX6_9HYPO|nr:Beta-lactamase/transpeptidase-like protein [Moelleriella libera RCEF 2490]